MTFKLVNRPFVRIDLTVAVEYYKEINPALAKQFLVRIKEAKEYIQKYPIGFQIKYNKVRTVLLKQFPYQIHYLIDDERKQIVILAIIHSYRKPTDYSVR